MVFIFRVLIFKINKIGNKWIINMINLNFNKFNEGNKSNEIE